MHVDDVVHSPHGCPTSSSSAQRQLEAQFAEWERLAGGDRIDDGADPAWAGRPRRMWHSRGNRSAAAFLCCEATSMQRGALVLDPTVVSGVLAVGNQGRSGRRGDHPLGAEAVHAGVLVHGGFAVSSTVLVPSASAVNHFDLNDLLPECSDDAWHRSVLVRQFDEGGRVGSGVKDRQRIQIGDK
ncbi:MULTISPECIES: hypothetical protein [unclassified Streptomyces]|uniref:hypothetical protein n=1 Tax=unclassified Streptomyces TaxID=2593676 RepID=UPI001BE57E5E|nr:MULTISPECIES: hypothetical protein [unclassified Streptomyces]MBT2402860.1 hypothetical protein [Streptomyces sp. ISL-21]MBT2612034.1 hypothetical protein [Streptomyces sp. ISL-87]